MRGQPCRRRATSSLRWSTATSHTQRDAVGGTPIAISRAGEPEPRDEQPADATLSRASARQSGWSRAAASRRRGRRRSRARPDVASANTIASPRITRDGLGVAGPEPQRERRASRAARRPRARAPRARRSSGTPRVDVSHARDALSADACADAGITGALDEHGERPHGVRDAEPQLERVTHPSVPEHAEQHLARLELGHRARARRLARRPELQQLAPVTAPTVRASRRNPQVAKWRSCARRNRAARSPDSTCPADRGERRADEPHAARQASASTPCGGRAGQEADVRESRALESGERPSSRPASTRTRTTRPRTRSGCGRLPARSRRDVERADELARAAPGRRRTIRSRAERSRRASAETR
jgi:hypothetical protein